MRDKTLSILTAGRDCLLLAVILFITPYLGGNDSTALFILQTLILAAWTLHVFVICLSGSPIFPYRRTRFSAFLFSGFLVYVTLQAVGGHAVFLKWLPGSVYRLETERNAVQMVLYALLFILLVDFTSLRKNRRIAVLALAIEVVALLIWVYYLKTNHLLGGTPENPSPLQFFAANSNHFGAALAAITPLFLAYAADLLDSFPFRQLRFGVRIIEAVFFLVLTALVTAAIFHVEARAAFVLQVAAVTFFCAFGVPLRSVMKLLGACLLIAAVMLIFNVADTVDLAKSAFQALPRSMEQRLLVNRDSLSIFHDYPIFGTGSGTYTWVARTYQSTNPELEYYVHNYNAYLELLTDTGPIGFALFFIPLGLLLSTSIRRCFLDRRETFPKAALASFLGIAVIALLSFVDSCLKTPAVAVFVVFHLAVIGSSAVSRDAADWMSEGRPETPNLKALLFLPLIFFLLVYTQKEWTAQSLLDKNGSLLAHGLSTNASKLDRDGLERSVALRPASAEAWALLGRAYEREAEGKKGETLHRLYGQAVEAYQRSVALAPTWPDTWLYLGRIKMHSRQRIEGIEDMGKALKLLPYNRDIYLYGIMNCLNLIDSSPWPEEREKVKRLAKQWLLQSNRLRRPFSKEDHDYIYNYDFDLRSPRKLTPDDDARFLSLLSET